jgi:ATP-binding cassette subfamily B (MDR/TAP) protein 1
MASLGLAFYFSWKLTLVIISVFPIAGIILYLISMPLTRAVDAQKQELTKASKYANTAIEAIDTVKAYNGEDQEVWQYYSTIKRVASSYMVQARISALQFGFTKLLMVGIFVQGFWFGLYLVDHGMDPGHVLTTFYACLAAMQSVETVLPQWLVIAKGISAGQTLKSIVDQMEHGRKVTHMIGSTKPTPSPGDIEVNEVSSK